MKAESNGRPAAGKSSGQPALQQTLGTWQPGASRSAS